MSITSDSILLWDSDLVGKVIDAETGEPIPRAVITGTWGRSYINFAGGYWELYDASETVSNANGEFGLKGIGLRLFTTIGTMSSSVYKAGYHPKYINQEKITKLGGIVKLQKIHKWDLMRKIRPPDSHGEASRKEEDRYRIMVGIDPPSSWKWEGEAPKKGFPWPVESLPAHLAPGSGTIKPLPPETKEQMCKNQILQQEAFKKGLSRPGTGNEFGAESFLSKEECDEIFKKSSSAKGKD